MIEIAKKTFLLLFFLSALAAFGKGWHLAKDGFLFRRALLPLIAQPTWHFPTLPEQKLRPILKQSFYYLGRGHQFYAFESADHQHVLKLPRYDRYCLPLWRRAWSFPLFRTREDVHQDLSHRFHFLMNSLEMASTDLQEETALLSVHFNETNQELPLIALFDQMGRKYWFDPNKYGFILQEKHPLLIPTWQTALHSGQNDEAQRILNCFLDFIAARAQKGIFNKDPSFIRNFSFNGNRVIQIDVGSFYRKSGHWIDSMNDTLGPFRNWLEETNPEWVAYLDERVAEIQTKR